MITEFHFIRPLWLLALIPLLGLIWRLSRQIPMIAAFGEVCDSHLLPYLIETKGYSRRIVPRLLLLVSGVMMIISQAGPTWSRLPVPTYQQIQPRVVVLDMSKTMLVKDLSPERLTRAKFKLHDLLQHKDIGQCGLVVYAGESFVASPLTDDGQTIDALLSSLTQDVMPVEGQQLDSALEEAEKLIVQAGFHHGQILVLTASEPSTDAINMAKTLAKAGIETSIMPVMAQDKTISPQFQQLAHAGQGKLIPFTDTSVDLDEWLAYSKGSNKYTENKQHEVPEWRDQGRWFLIPALVLLLPVFRRGWWQGMNT